MILQPRDYQAIHSQHLVMFLVEGDRIVGLLYCTGAGKSLVIRMIGWILLNQHDFTHFVILTPRDQIQSSFSGPDVLRDGTHLIPLEGQGITREDDQGQKIKGRKWTRGDLKRYFISPNLKKHGITSNYQLFCPLMDEYHRLERDGGPRQDFRYVILVLDEGHHTYDCKDIPQEERQAWARARQFFLDHGGRIIVSTATAQRMDNEEEVVPDKFDGKAVRRCERSLGMQMAAGFAPGHLVYDFVKIEYNQSIEPETGESRTLLNQCSDEDVADQMYREWVADGFPATNIVLSHRGNREAHQNLINAIIRKFRGSPEARIMDTTDCIAPGGGERLQAALDTSKRPNAMFQCLPNTILTLQRVVEGVDTSWVSHIYFYGIPKSFQRVVQSIGRGTRCKFLDGTKEHRFSGYPERWEDTTKVVFFVADRTPDAVEESRYVLSVTCYLDALQDVCLFRAIKDYIDVPKGQTREQAFERVIDPNMRGLCLEWIHRAYAWFESRRTPLDEDLGEGVVRLAVHMAKKSRVTLSPDNVRLTYRLMQARQGRLNHVSPQDLAHFLGLSKLGQDFRAEVYTPAQLHELASHHVLTWVQRVRSEVQKLPRDTQFILKETKEFVRLKNRLPWDLTNDRLPSGSRCNYLDVALSRGCAGFEKVEGGFRGLMLNTFGHKRPWYDTFSRIDTALDDGSDSARRVASNLRKEVGRGRYIGLQTQFGRVAEVCLYPGALCALRALRQYPDIYTKLTLSEAHELGRLRWSTSAIRRYVHQHGVEALKSRIPQGGDL